MKRYFFISGLPRSGSTLLSAILRQNPDFYADIASPVSGIMTDSINSMTGCEQSTNIDAMQRKQVLHGIMNGYYHHVDKPVIFDSSRTWTAKTALLRQMWPYTKLLCCVRDVRWILDSFERIAAQNPFYTNNLVEQETHHSVETRCRGYMDPTKHGQVIKPLKWLEQGLALNPDMIHVVEYDQLCKNPLRIMQGIYRALDMPYWPHDFESVEYDNEPFDRSCNMPGLHRVKTKVAWTPRRTILPKEVWDAWSTKPSWIQDAAASYD